MNNPMRIGLTDDALADLTASGLEPRDMHVKSLTPTEMAATGIGGGYTPDGYVIPYFDIEGNLEPYYRVKILDPRAPAKYRAIKDMPNHVYFPVRFHKLIQDPLVNYVIITEGEKKAAAACKAGFPCIALSGVDNWRNRQLILPETTVFKPDKQRNVIKAKIPSGVAQNLQIQDAGISAKGFDDLIELLISRDMEAIIVFDSDGPSGVKPQVQRAAAQLGYELRYRGLPIAKIRQLVLPAGKGAKVGLDDYLVAKGSKTFAASLRACRKKRIAFPTHPNAKAFVSGRLQKGVLTRKETQDVSLAILMELETRGKRLRNKATQDMFFFSNKTHTLMEVALGNPRVMLHDTFFGSYLYREFNVAAADNRVIGWLAAQFNGEPGIEEVITHKVMAKVEGMPDCIAYQLSDSHFVIVTPNKKKPYMICENGEHGVLFEQGCVDPVSPSDVELMIEDYLERDDVLWLDVVSSFDFTAGLTPKSDALGPDEQSVEEGRYLATLLYYMSPWLLRWRGTQLPVEMIIGEPGSGKSSLYSLRQTILTGQPRLSNMTNDVRDWYAGITSSGGLYVLDNVHFTGSNKDYQQRLSDELCRLVTEPDPHVELRKLYTTSDIVSLPVNVTFALTSIEQPFYTTDLIQRAAIFELQAISRGHDAAWLPKQLAKAGGRAGWIGHQLAVLHKFMALANEKGMWDNNYKARHRLANYEQCLTLMAKVLGLPYEWIPQSLHKQTATKMSETDWTLAGLTEYADDFRKEHGEAYKGKKFTVKDVVTWAEVHSTYHKNPIMTNSWKLGKYLRSHRGSLLKNTGIHENGTSNNRITYAIQ